MHRIGALQAYNYIKQPLVEKRYYADGCALGHCNLNHWFPSWQVLHQDVGGRYLVIIHYYEYHQQTQPVYKQEMILPDRPTFQIAPHKYSLDHVDNGQWDQYFLPLSTETRHLESASQHSVMQLKKRLVNTMCLLTKLINRRAQKIKARGRVMGNNELSYNGLS